MTYIQILPCRGNISPKVVELGLYLLLALLRVSISIPCSPVLHVCTFYPHSLVVSNNILQGVNGLLILSGDHNCSEV